MSEDRLWAPWRLNYVSGDNAEPAAPPSQSAWQSGADHNCFLCRAAARYDAQPEADRQLLVVRRSANSLILLNRYPYNNGHVLVAPLRHVGELDELSPDEHLACMNELARLTRIFRRRMKAEGFNVGLNLGRVAGAGVPGHLHWHLVPRWPGDHNFMPVVADTRVISLSLDALWEVLTAENAQE